MEDGRKSKNLLKLAFRISHAGIHPAHKMGSIILKGGRVLAHSHNISKRYGTENRGKHAEERLLRRTARKHNLKGAIIIVARTNKHCEPRTMSRPCPRCLEQIKKYGIKKMIYIDWNDRIVIERIGVT